MSARTKCRNGHDLTPALLVKSKSGYTECRLCYRIRKREASRRKAGTGVGAARTRRYYETHPEATKRHRANRDPIKERARKLLCEEVREGRIVRPSACEECGSTNTPPHGHHQDYARPLDVEWLCPVCHGKRHRKDDNLLAGKGTT